MIFSNGFSFIGSNLYDKSNTPIESIAYKFNFAIKSLYYRFGYVNLNIVALVMGGFGTAYMLEHYKFPVNLKYFIYMTSPFGGSPFASIAKYLGLSLVIGYQVNGMVPGSLFLNNLNSNQYYLYTNYP